MYYLTQDAAQSNNGQVERFVQSITLLKTAQNSKEAAHYWVVLCMNVLNERVSISFVNGKLNDKSNPNCIECSSLEAL